MEGFKDFYNNRHGKEILFFGFYLIFFIFLAIYLRGFDNNKTTTENEIEAEQIITSYNLSKLVNNDYKYNISIIDNEENITFTGIKSNVDYANYSNKYFLDIYNINQLLKKSKFIDSKDYILTYELNNSEINDILLTSKEEGINKIYVHVNNKTEVKKIVMDLSKYLEKDKYEITINYLVGEENENSPS